MNINGIGHTSNRVYTPYQDNKSEQSFAEYMDKAYEKKDVPEEEETRTEVVVRPDGSKILMITVDVGGTEAVTSVELAKPTPENIPCKDITGDVDINNVTEKLADKVDKI